MKTSIRNKLSTLDERFEQLNGLLATPEVIHDQNKFREISKEHASLNDLINAWRRHLDVENALSEAQTLCQEGESDMKEMAEEEVLTLKQHLASIQAEIDVLLLPQDPHDQSNIFIEIRAGTGGNEASLFAGDLLRMYTKYAEIQGWKMEILSISGGEVGGYKEVITRIVGKNAYAQLKFESGAHRVQRVPTTESQGRVHTSACTVAVIPEPNEAEAIEIETKDLRIDTFRASGAGGQHVNKTDSAIRITHLPTGLAVECQQGRSQHQNKAKALAILQARLIDDQQRKALAEQTAQRKSLVGSGDRSERIRTYNFPQGRVTDHRINLTEYKLQQMLEGEMDCILESLIREHQAELMAQMDD